MKLLVGRSDLVRNGISEEELFKLKLVGWKGIFHGKTWGMYWFARAAIKKYYKRSGLRQQNLFS